LKVSRKIQKEAIRMKKSTTEVRRFTPRITLAAIGMKLRSLKLFGIIEQAVHIRQKSIKYKPIEKLYNAFVTILAGAKGMVEVNTRVREDRALQLAFGLKGCAEQSVVQETLSACNVENVAQMEQALATTYRNHSLGYKHDYQKEFQLLDVDMTGMPCGKKAAFSTKGYFARQRNRQGRQMGRVLATNYEEVVVDRLYPGNIQLNKGFQGLVKAACETLELDLSKRQRTILRVDGGGGTTADINWALGQGYQFHGKDYSAKRAKKLSESVTEWFSDPRNPGRQVGFVMAEAREYVRPVIRIAVRCRKNNNQWAVGVILSTLQPWDVVRLAQQPVDFIKYPHKVLLSYVYFYDQRSGGVEIEIKEDKQGLGISKRNKKRFEAQQMVMLLATLAHNVLVWARRWLSSHFPKIAGYGMLRLVRDLLHISGFVIFNSAGNIVQIVLNRDSKLARRLFGAIQSLLKPEHVGISLGET
jgi:hypothetical protein